MMKPVLIRAFGRTGTTLLMQLLGTSNNIFVPNEYPFESRYLSYFTRMVRLMDERYSDKSYKDGDVLDLSQNVLGNCPYDFPSIVNSEDLKKRMLLGIWNQFSFSVNEKNNNDFLYYAEKVSLDLAPFINSNLPSVKNIYLVRDPRGELASIISFNKKRNFNGFGWLEGDDEFSFAERMIESRKVYFNTLSEFNDNNKNIIVLRFEDVVSDLSLTARKLNDFLNVEIDCQAVLDNAVNMAHHMTSKSIQDSSCKWRDELCDDTIDLFKDKMKSELEFFNYYQ